MKDIFLIIYIFYNTMEFYVLVGTLTFVYEFNSAWNAENQILIG